MPTEEQKSLEEAVRRGHEHKDIRVRRIIVLSAALALGVPLLMGVVWLMFRSLSGTRYTGNLRPTVGWPQNVETRTQRFPEPRLQTVPGDQLHALRAKEDLELNTYGWINRTQGVVRIPIERAMDLLAQRGLPVRGSKTINTGKSEYELIQERRSSEERK